eukprot:CAMPEP_0178997104 /NCGR_PEP_ID=MMETSP0795-20121207/8745_1 /TAXON_ID=88552 /ORGANISM="Amoebophrya sp., Strain Ameob2" /LENGTH=441 /DNA_ID=CAMNT_0020689581 /DNA_START=54 /DNA_END=1379 /DNA_ORIENTATION=+
MSWFFKVEDPKIQVLVPSELHELEESDFHHKRFVVLGGGKTGMDALVWLQRAKKVESGRISWVVGKETWMLNREKPASAGVLADTVLDEFGANETGYLETALDKLVDQGRLLMVGEEGEPRPTEFRFPIIDSEELSYLREVTRYQGYVEKLELVIDPAPTKDDGGAKPKEDEGSVRIHFKEKMNSEQGAKMSDEEKPVTVGKAKDVVFIHCTAPGPFFNINRKPPPLYEGSHQMNLKNISPPPVPQSASTLAWIETGRRLNAAYGGEHGALRESVEKILGGERGGATMSIDEDMIPEESLAKLIRHGLSATPENFAHVWNTGILNCLDFVKRSASSKAKRCRTCTSPRVRVAPPARSGYPLPPGFDKFPSYRTFLDGNRLMAFGPPPIRRQHLETMEKLEACMSKRKSAMISEKNGVDGETDLAAVRSMVEIMKEQGLRGR